MYPPAPFPGGVYPPPPPGVYPPYIAYPPQPAPDGHGDSGNGAPMPPPGYMMFPPPPPGMVYAFPGQSEYTFSSSIAPMVKIAVAPGFPPFPAMIPVPAKPKRKQVKMAVCLILRLTLTRWSDSVDVVHELRGGMQKM